MSSMFESRLGVKKLPKMPPTPRQRILARELKEMKELAGDSSIIEIVPAEGAYPDKYLVIFHGPCLVPDDAGEVVMGNRQEVELRLGMEYPRSAPQVRWITDIIHPNIFSHGVCFGNFASQWTPNFHLVDMVEILWDYARLKILNPASAGPSASNHRLTWEQLHAKFHYPFGKPLRDLLVKKDDASSALNPISPPEDIVIMPDDQDRC